MTGSVGEHARPDKRAAVGEHRTRRPRYAFAELAAAMGLTEAQAARKLGLSGTTEADYRKRGVTERVADRLAVKAGLHFFEVWPELVDDAGVACEECGELFHPYRKNHRFCSQRCGNRRRERDRQRERYQTDPEYAEALRAARRAYYQEVSARAERLASRRRWHTDPEYRERQNELRRQRRARARGEAA